MLLVAGAPRFVTGASVMKIAALTLASTFALVIGCAQPVFAQTQDQTGAGNQPYAQDRSDTDNNGNATTGANTDEQNGNWRDDTGEQDGARGDRQWNERRMGMGPMMWRRHQTMMNAMGGAHFHFARGKARIDIRCPAQTNLQACVHAATELLDKIAELRHGGDNTTGSAAPDNGETNGSAAGQQPNAQPGAAPGTGTPQAPRAPGDRM
jgi:hypothetical protein